ncbi:protein TusB [Pseudescherichia vulneris NBRC 102420]|uniref:Protein TusB n=1 Tax=Pseudescherichia vulneris NBRC 102420 TaxID=1115515 RepID=A0A090V313_PSEVU|nr:sulfurtransferase complex subunit TusB [Pseudescherichia vulneris]GAL59285.1 protein TusB [Pseudescherichia vulneris NBRC 102420]STQ58025.1 tRNA 2-thiouridine synthesizing protein B [Pseudescherichia vulneris]HBC82096.1 sulfurtransferase complex subunit TusB [Escherichia sp.]
MLHTLRHSPWQCDMAALMRTLQEGDDLLLLSDGVTAAVVGGHYLDLLLAAPITVHALQEDVDARALSGQISNRIVLVSYTDFVSLTVKHAAQIAW